MMLPIIEALRVVARAFTDHVKEDVNNA